MITKPQELIAQAPSLKAQLAAVTQELEQAKADLARQVKLNEHFACNTCGGIGVVGNAPDDYYDCPDCKSYDDMKAELEQAVFEREKAYRARDSLARQYGNLSTDYHNLKVKSFKSFNDDECWIYQGDESDNLESLICPVVISAKDLIQLKQSSVVMPEIVGISKTALDLYKAPFSYQYGYIFDANGQTFADNSCESDESIECSKTGSLALRVRGWGRISYLKTEFDNGEIQDEVGRLIAVALTEYWNKALATNDKEKDSE